MKQKLSPARFLPLALAISLLAAPATEAAVVISNMQLSTTSISFDVSGTMPETAPAFRLGTLFVTNPSVFAAPGYTLSFEQASAASLTFSGTQILTGVFTAFEPFSDSVDVQFDSDFTPGGTFAGTLSATWATAELNPAAVSALNVYWGSAVGGGLYQAGILLGGNVPVAVVPEPSSTLVLGLSGLALLARRKRA